jgi:hypothetical protein
VTRREYRLYATEQAVVNRLIAFAASGVLIFAVLEFIGRFV